MKTCKRNRLISLALTGSFGLFGATSALAAAGDFIFNRATLSYDVGNVPQTVIESSDVGNSTPGVGSGADTVFLEDRVVNFTVTETAGITTNVAPDATLQVQTFEITNTGNGTQDFLLTALDNVNGVADPFGGATSDNFDVVSSQVFVETANAGFAAADDTAVFVDQLAPAATATVYIVSTIPDDLVVSDGDVAVMSLVAQVAVGNAVSANTADFTTAGAAITNDDNNNVSPAGNFSNGDTVVVAGVANDIADQAGTVQTVFNDPVGTLDSAGAADIAQNGQASANSSYTVATPILTVSKTSQVIYDPINLDAFTVGNNPKALPSAYVQYTITISNDATATASAELTTLSDAIDAFSTGTVNLDANLLDAGKVLGATLNFPGDEESALGNIRVDTSGTARGAAGLSYCTSGADADGCDYSGDPNGSVSVDFSTVASMAAEAGYTVGELKPNETVVIVFNVIVQ